MSDINQNFNGLNPLAYLGVVAIEPTDFITLRRDPTTKDRQFQLGTWWLNSVTYTMCYLANLDNNIATWVCFTRQTNFHLMTGDSGGPIAPDANFNLNILSGTPGLLVNGDPVSHSLTLNNAALANQYVTDAGTAIPAAGVLNVLGGLNIDTSGAGNTVTVKTPTLAEGVLYTNNAGVYTSIGKGDDGETLIGATGGTPAWNPITSSGGSIVVTNTANAIDLSVVVVPTGITVAFSAYLSATTASFTTAQYFYICDTELFDIDGSYNAATGIFTVPSDGYYMFTTTAMSFKAAASTSYFVGFRVNAATDYVLLYRQGEYSSTGGVTPLQDDGAILLSLVAGNTVKPYFVASATGTSLVGSATIPYTVFSGFKFKV